MLGVGDSAGELVTGGGTYIPLVMLRSGMLGVGTPFGDVVSGGGMNPPLVLSMNGMLVTGDGVGLLVDAVPERRSSELDPENGIEVER